MRALAQRAYFSQIIGPNYSDLVEIHASPHTKVRQYNSLINHDFGQKTREESAPAVSIVTWTYQVAHN